MVCLGLLLCLESSNLLYDYLYRHYPLRQSFSSWATRTCTCQEILSQQYDPATLRQKWTVLGFPSSRSSCPLSLSTLLTLLWHWHEPLATPTPTLSSCRIRIQRTTDTSEWSSKYKSHASAFSNENTKKLEPSKLLQQRLETGDLPSWNLIPKTKPHSDWQILAMAVLAGDQGLDMSIRSINLDPQNKTPLRLANPSNGSSGGWPRAWHVHQKYQPWSPKQLANPSNGSSGGWPRAWHVHQKYQPWSPKQNPTPTGKS